MVTANAAKKSRAGASRSATTTASNAKRSRKSGAEERSRGDWEARDQDDAGVEGWGLFTCIDMRTRNVFMEIFGVDDRFTDDNKAREHVARRGKAGDELAVRAIRVVFQSKVPAKARSK